MDIEFDTESEDGPFAVHKLSFKVKDEEGVEWELRISADDGEVVLEQVRFEPGKRIMRDMARMSPAGAREMIEGLKLMAEVADVHNVDAVHRT